MTRGNKRMGVVSKLTILATYALACVVTTTNASTDLPVQAEKSQLRGRASDIGFDRDELLEEKLRVERDLQLSFTFTNVDDITYSDLPTRRSPPTTSKTRRRRSDGGGSTGGSTGGSASGGGGSRGRRGRGGSLGLGGRRLAGVEEIGEDLPQAAYAPWHLAPSFPSEAGDEELDEIVVPPKVYLFESLQEQTQNFGVRASPDQKLQEKEYSDAFGAEICAAAAETSPSEPCINTKLDLKKCVSCSSEEGYWYSGVSKDGAVSGVIDEDNSILFADAATDYKHVEVAVAATGNDDSKLLAFASRLAQGVKDLGNDNEKVSVGLVVARHKGDNMSPELQHELASAAGMTKDSSAVRFVEIDQAPDENGVVRFNRAKALNTLHKASCLDHTLERCLVTVVDVDMDIGASFFRNAMAYAFPGASVYFPMVFSEFNPETVRLVEESMGMAAGNPDYKLPTFSPHRGVWRQFGFGLYALSGADARDLVLDESFVGWGGEDNDFYGRVSQSLHIVRMKEQGLIHVWHPKECTVGEFVEPSRYHACIGSMSAVEGSPLGWYLRSENEKNSNPFSAVSRGGVEKQVAEIQVKHISEAQPDEKDQSAEERAAMMQAAEKQVAEIQPLSAASEDEDEDPMSPAISEDSKILLAVVSSRKQFKSRVGQIASSWGKNLPPSVSVLYVVGGESDLVADQETPGSWGDVESLAQQAGLSSASSIVVLDGVSDNEYPPVRKAASMVARLGAIVEEQSNIEWAMKVDDDTYVNIDALVKFTMERDSTAPHFYGQRGLGRKEDKEGLEKGGLKKPFCMGGTGYLMSRRTLLETAGSIGDRLEEIDNSEYREFLWHSDVLVGLSVYQGTGLGCWEGDESKYEGSLLFRQNYLGLDPDSVNAFMDGLDLSRTITAHPFKNGMEALHRRQTMFAVDK